MSTLQKKQAKVKALREQITDLRGKIEEIEAEMKPLELEIACEVSGFNVGDLIEWGGWVKYRGRVLQVKLYNNQQLDRIVVRRVLKNGSAGQAVNAYSFDKPIVVMPCEQYERLLKEQQK